MLKKFIASLLLGISLVVFPSVALGQSGTINQLTQWLTSGGYVKMASTTAGLWVPSLGSSGNCLVTDINGKVSTQTCSSGGGGSGVGWTWNSINLLRTTTTTDDVLIGRTATTTRSKLEVNGTTTATNFVATSTTASSSFANGINLTSGCIAYSGTCISLTGGTSNWATTSSDYWISTYGKGYFYSTTSSDYWDTTKSRWATTSNTYWLTQQTTSLLTEGTNLYYTLARVLSGLTGQTVNTSVLVATSTATDSTFNRLVAVSATSTNATTTGSQYAASLTVGSLTGLLEATAGAVSTAILGTDYVNGSGVSGNCVKWGASNSLGDTGAPCGSGGSASAAGSQTQIQYNGGSNTFAATNTFTFATTSTDNNLIVQDPTGSGFAYASLLSSYSGGLGTSQLLVQGWNGSVLPSVLTQANGSGWGITGNNGSVNQMSLGAGTALTNDFINDGRNFAIGTTTAQAKLTLQGEYGNQNDLLAIATTTNSSGSATSTALAVQASGNVVIGTTTAQKRLTVNLASLTYGNRTVQSSADGIALVGNSATYILRDTGSSNQEMSWNFNGGVGEFGTVNAGNFAIKTNATQRLTVRSDGRIGISSTTPGVDLAIGNSATQYIALATTSTSTFSKAIYAPCFSVDNINCLTSSGGSGASSTLLADANTFSNASNTIVFLNSARSTSTQATSTNLFATIFAATTGSTTQFFSFSDNGWYNVSSSSVDVGAQANAAYAAGSAAGVTIVFHGYGTSTFATPMVFSTFNKPVRLLCPEGTVLNYTGTGTSTLINMTGLNYSHRYGSGVDGCNFNGPDPFGTTKGLVIGGTNGGEGVNLNNVTIGNFGTGLIYGDNTWNNSMTNGGLVYNGKNFESQCFNNCGENFKFIGVNFVGNAVQYGKYLGMNCVDMSAGFISAVTFTDTTWDDCAPSIGPGVLMASWKGGQAENPGYYYWAKYPFWSIASSTQTHVVVEDFTIMNDAPTASTTDFVFSNGANLEVKNLTIHNNNSAGIIPLLAYNDPTTGVFHAENVLFTSTSATAPVAAISNNQGTTPTPAIGQKISEYRQVYAQTPYSLVVDTVGRAYTYGNLYFPSIINSTTTAATTTSLFSTTASSTNLFSQLANFGTLTVQTILANGSTTLQNFTGLKATTTAATTTNLFSSIASSTNLFTTNFFAGGLNTCNAANQALTYTNGQFGCNSAITAASSTLLANNNTFSGANSFATLLVTGSTTLQNFTGLKSTTTNATSTSLAVTGISTSTFANGISITSGCFAIGSTCLSSGGSGASSTALADNNTFTGANIFNNITRSTTTDATTTNIFSTKASTSAFFGAGLSNCSSALSWTNGSFGCVAAGAAASTTLLADNNTFSGVNNFTGKVGHGTSSPYARLSVQQPASDLTSPIFMVQSSSTAANPMGTTTLGIDKNGLALFGTSSADVINGVNSFVTFATQNGHDEYVSFKNNADGYSMGFQIGAASDYNYEIFKAQNSIWRLGTNGNTSFDIRDDTNGNIVASIAQGAPANTFIIDSVGSIFSAAINIFRTAGNNLFSIVADSQQIFWVTSTSTDVTGSGARVSIGHSSTTPMAVLDHLKVDGRYNNGDNALYECVGFGNYNSATNIVTNVSNTVSSVTTGTPCGPYSWIEDAAGQVGFFSTQGHSYLKLSAGATGVTNAIGNGMAMRFNTAWLASGTNTPVMQLHARPNTANASSTVFLIGFSTSTGVTAGATIQTEDPKVAGCYFIATTTANWQAVCATANYALKTQVDTGIASSTTIGGSGQWREFRIELSSTAAYFYIESVGDTGFTRVATITTNIPTTLSLNPTISVGKNSAGLSPSIDIGGYVRTWAQLAVPSF